MPAQKGEHASLAKTCGPNGARAEQCERGGGYLAALLVKAPARTAAGKSSGGRGVGGGGDTRPRRFTIRRYFDPGDDHTWHLHVRGRRRLRESVAP